MEEELFDIAIEGTTLKSLFIPDEDKKVVVVDSAGNYGTTYSTIAALQESRYISDLRIHLSSYFECERRMLLVEAVPFVLFSKDRRISEFSETVDFVNINDIYFFTGMTFHRIPTSKNDILKLGLSHEDIHSLYKSILNQDINIMKTNFSDRNHFIFKAFVEMRIFDDDEFRRYCQGFGEAVFVYPRYGISEISESLAMQNAFKGTTYIINKSLRMDFYENDEYKYVFTCDLGRAKAKEFRRNTLVQKEYFVRVIVIKKECLSGNFVGYIDNEDSSVTEIICLDCDAEVCSDGYQIIYFINRCNEITDKMIEKLSGFSVDRVLDMSFKTVYDISQFKNV